MSWKKVGNWFTSQAFAFLLIALGLAVVVFALIAYGFRGLLFEPYIDPSISGQFGDFIGGVVGAVWALAGVILFYEALRLQRKDLRNSRKEFVLNRLTNVVYKQLENVFRAIDNLEIEIDGSTYHGDAALDQIHENISVEGLGKMLPKDQLDSHEWDINKEKIENSMRFIHENDQNIFNFLVQIHYSTIAMKSAFEVEEDLYNNVEKLKKLYFDNIGWKRNWTLDQIMYTTKAYYQDLSEFDGELLSKNQGLLYKRYIEDFHDFKNNSISEIYSKLDQSE